MKILGLIILLFHFQFSYSQNQGQKSFTIDGEIIGMDSGILKLYYIDTSNKFVVDSSLVIGGKFKFAGSINHPIDATLDGPIISRNSNDLNTTSLFLSPGHLKVTLMLGDFKNLTVGGSPFNEEWLRFEQADSNYLIRKTLGRMYDLTLDSLKRDPTNTALQKKGKVLLQELREFAKNNPANAFIYATQHPNSYLSAYLLRLYLYRYSLDSAKHLLNRFSNDIANSYYGIKIAENIRGIEGGNPGSFAKDFTAKDIKGDSITLSSFKGKNFVLLDFWATWCIPCRQNNPILASLYEKYKPKGLEIIGIANDDNRIDIWKTAINDDKMHWINVLQGANTNNDIGKLYAIQPIPVYILIDKNGRIILRFEGEQNAMLESTLSSLLK